ncbi:polymorphic toxin-type HINT domain-containing protein, partial [Streptomyces sp. NPDC001553]|uniref:polymorphic toxin-type HINT domain-containing protein n=1 Tax=Streptomyces sp. NPDC001553 TaxID=3154385 RepID=UPI00332A16F7
KALKIIKEMPAIAKALKRIVTGLNDFLDKSAAAKKLLAKGEEVLEKLRKKNPPCVPGKKHSFAPGTPVRMADGTNKPIQDIRVGEQVLATDPETGKTAARAVTHLIVGEGDKNLRELTIDTDGAAGQATGTITATDIHPFWVENRHTWVNAADLKPGDRLRTPEGELKELIGLRAWNQRMRVHNLTVDDLHTYYVMAGETSILVHNADCGPDLGDSWTAKKPKDLPSDKGGCEDCAMKIIELLGGGEVRRIVPKNAPGLWRYRGHDVPWGDHYVVFKDGHIFDGWTGRRGQSEKDYMAEWEDFEELYEMEKGTLTPIPGSSRYKWTRK